MGKKMVERQKELQHVPNCFHLLVPKQCANDYIALLKKKEQQHVKPHMFQICLAL